MKFGKITQIFLPENPLTAKKEFENQAGFNENKISKIKGFCIIYFDSIQAIKKILSQKFIFKTKELLVKEFIQNTDEMDKIDLENCLRRIYVMNIPQQLNEVQFAAIITAAFGDIEKSYLRNNQKYFRENNKEKVQNRKYGFVTFKTKESRDKAINQGTLIDPQSRKWVIKAFQSKNENRNLKMKEIEEQNNLLATQTQMLTISSMINNQQMFNQYWNNQNAYGPQYGNSFIPNYSQVPGQDSASLFLKQQQSFYNKSQIKQQIYQSTNYQGYNDHTQYHYQQNNKFTNELETKKLSIAQNAMTSLNTVSQNNKSYQKNQIKFTKGQRSSELELFYYNKIDEQEKMNLNFQTSLNYHSIVFRYIGIIDTNHVPSNIKMNRLNNVQRRNSKTIDHKYQ